MSTIRTGEGFKTYLGVAREATFGTEAARSAFFEVNDESLAKTQETLVSGTVYGAGIHNDNATKGRTGAGGGISYDCHYTSGEVLLEAMFGTSTSYQPDATASSTVWRHHFSIRDHLDRPLTMEVYRDTSRFESDANKPFIYAGCEINSAEWSISENGILVCSLDIIGQNEVAGDADEKSTPTFTRGNIITYAQGVLKWNDEEVSVSDATITMNNNLDGDRRFIGSYLRSQALRAGDISVAGRFVAEFDDWTSYDDFCNNTSRAFSLTFTGAAIDLSYDYAIQFDVTKAKFQGHGCTVSDKGKITEEMEFNAYRDVNYNELRVTLTNINDTF